MTPPVFIYLDIESRKSAHLNQNEIGVELEIQYSISTLRADGTADRNIVIYTDKPDRYTAFPARVIDISRSYPDRLRALGYVYVAKPYVLLRALREFGGACVFLDSDTYILEGFSQAVTDMLEEGAVLWEVDFPDALSRFPADIPPYPHRAAHALIPGIRPDGNSGVIGLKAGWGEAILEDALHAIEAMRNRGNRLKTLEQTAICESLWLNGIKTQESRRWIQHYCTNSQKRYMHSQIKKLISLRGRPLPPAAPAIRLTTPRVKLYQYYWDVRRTLKGAQAALLKA
jgi:hypothetical protein